MIEIKIADIFPIRRCIYCKGQGEENIVILSDRWDNHPELDPKNIVGMVVSVKGDMFEILFDDSSVGLGAPKCFQLAAKRLSKADKVKRLRGETGAPLMPTKVLLDNHSYDDAKRIIMDVQKEVKDRGVEDWTIEELGSQPFWKRQMINADRPRLAAGESDDE